MTFEKFSDIISSNVSYSIIINLILEDGEHDMKMHYYEASFSS